MDDQPFEFEKPVFELEQKIEELKNTGRTNKKLNMDKQILGLEKQLEKLKKDVYSKLSSWEKTQIARHPKRPYMLDYVEALFTDFMELHGDRRFSDDHAMIAGFARFEDRKVMVIGQQKGRNIKENMKRNFGSPNPEGYRKALRFMLLAEKYNLPIITFIDTQGAYCGLGGEERGQAEAIAYNLMKMSSLTVPMVTIVTGEGGSGGALGIAQANKVLMLEHSIYSVISPEGCAAILWRDSAKASEAADQMKITSEKLFSLGVVDKIIPEPLGGAHKDYDVVMNNVKKNLASVLKKLCAMDGEKLVSQRYKKFRKLGEFFEGNKLVSSKIS